jgi:lipoprotein-anchoring transpeptidase ErfK/SrfK
MFQRCVLAVLLSTGGAALAIEPVKAPAMPAAKPAAPEAAKPAAPAEAAAPAAAGAAAAAPDAAIVIPAAITAPQRALIRLQVLLDRAHFSPGVIDGRDGGNLKLAEGAYRTENKLGDADVAALTDKLVAADAEPTVKRYTITDADVAGPFVEHLPTDMAELAKLDSPAFAGPVEELAERFHMDEPLLKALNPGADFTKVGTVVTVAAVGAEKLGGAVTRIEVDKTANSVRALGDGGKLLAVYPATVGSQERPAPAGTWKVRTVATKATYTFDPKRLTFGKAAEGKLTIKAGPNNPIGTTWIDLTKDTYGIHGSPDPRLIGKRASHGCVRLTNWDVEQLAKSVKAGATVVFTGTETRAKT